MKNDSEFGFVHVKTEGGCVRYDKDEKESPPSPYKWTYVERRVPLEYAYELHLVIDRFLEGKGVLDL